MTDSPLEYAEVEWTPDTRAQGGGGGGGGGGQVFRADVGAERDLGPVLAELARLALAGREDAP